jgi:putative hydrolase of the HAD superfamily
MTIGVAMTVKAVVFDLGGVLTSSPMTTLSDFLRGTNDSPPDVYAWFTDPAGPWAAYETGRLDETEALAALKTRAADLGFELDVTAFVEAFWAGFEVQQEMLDIVAAVRRSAVVGCLSNTVRRGGSPELFGVDRMRLFDVVVASCDVGVRKPDEAIYRIMCRRLGVDLADTVFFDDHAPNVEAAASLGMVAILFRSAESTARDLERLGVALGQA